MVVDARHSTLTQVAVKQLGMKPEANRQGKTASLCGKTIDRKVKTVLDFDSSLKATAPEIVPGAFLCCCDTRQWVMEEGYFQTRPNTDQRAHPDS